MKAAVAATGAVVTFRTDRMVNSTELKRLLRALDGLYYAELFSGEAPYSGRPEVWRAWVHFGFGTGLQQGPPVAEEPDRIRISTHSDGKDLTFTVSGGNARAFSRWANIIRVIDTARPSLAGLPDERRAEALGKSVPAVAALNKAVAEGLAASHGDDQARVRIAIQRALDALTYPIVSHCRITTSD